MNQAHNGYIEVYLNLGWIGLALLSIVIIGGYRSIITSLRQDAERGSLRLGYLMIALIYNCTEASFKFMTPVWFGFLLSTIAVPTNVGPSVPEKDPKVEKGNRRGNSQINPEFRARFRPGIRPVAGTKLHYGDRGLHNPHVKERITRASWWRATSAWPGFSA
jgi:hypothetical protein